MKTLTNFFTKYPSYTKCGNSRISQRTGISENTIQKFKKTALFAAMRNQYKG